VGPPPDSGPSGDEARYRESWQEIAIYVAAGISFIVLGIVLRTALLNWIVGPAFVVTFVVLANRWLGRRKGVRR
jgi:NhaP-type Na+/H+ or K+/H+ antiporter